jgi:hypothetical protein
MPAVAAIFAAIAAAMRILGTYALIIMARCVTFVHTTVLGTARAGHIHSSDACRRA